MLDLHSVYDSVGSTDTIVSENNANAVIPAGDGATNIGLSPHAGARLLVWGAHSVAAASAIVTLGLQSNNLVDPSNKLAQTFTGIETSIIAEMHGSLPYTKGANYVQYAQEAAGKLATYKIDWVQTGNFAGNWGSLFPFTTEDSRSGQAIYSATFGAATAGAYASLVFNPSPTPPIGTYAILGAKVSGLTAAAVLRFQHSDFGGAFPGFPVVDHATGALTPSNFGTAELTDPVWDGQQFVRIGHALQSPVCPVFSIQGQSTGLTMQLIDTNADTATVVLNLLKLN